MKRDEAEDIERALDDLRVRVRKWKKMNEELLEADMGRAQMEAGREREEMEAQAKALGLELDAELVGEYAAVRMHCDCM